MFEQPFFIFLGLACFLAFYPLFCHYELLYSKEGLMPFPIFFQKTLGDKGIKSLLLLASFTSLCLPFYPLLSGILWLFYYLLCRHDTLFLSYQWDSLLLEILFLTTLQSLCPPLFQSSFHLLWTLLLCRLVWGCGWAKLTSQGSTWRDFNALSYHWWTQPLPLYGAYWLYQLPQSIQKVLSFSVLFSELLLPFFLWIPSLDSYARIILSLFQLVLSLTSNFGFFPFLVLSLCHPPLIHMQPTLPSYLFIAPALLVTLSLCFLHLCLLLETVFTLPPFFEKILHFAKKKRLVATYALFGKMRLDRKEILIKYAHVPGQWSYIHFSKKPHKAQKTLPLMSFFLPRLEWQLWFSSFSSFQTQHYLHDLAYLLLKGKGPVAIQPPPQYLQFELWEFSFSSYKKSKQGMWIKKRLGPYSPVMENPSKKGDACL